MFSVKFITVFAIFGAVECKFNVGYGRSKRYLVYPDGGPARAQFILGLGIPVDLKEQAVTVGTVIKFQYDLPNNSTDYTSRIYGFVNTVSRGMDEHASNVENEDEGHNKTDNYKYNNSNEKTHNEIDEDDGDVLVDLNFSHKDEHRRKRSMIYTEGGLMNSNSLGIEGDGKISLDEAIRRQEIIDQKIDEEEEPPRRANRWDYYKILEQMIERYGVSGRPCLLRTICEAAEVPFTHESGLLAEIGHVLFTPSTTKDELSHHTDNEYHAAERLGRDENVDCETLFPECEASILDTFTEIGLDTLHRFGLS